MAILNKPPLFNQRKIPACLAHSFVSMIQYSMYGETGKVVNLSPRFLDILSGSEELDINDGRSFELMAEIMSTIGCCTEDLLPNDTTLSVEEYRSKSVITNEMLVEASRYRTGRDNIYAMDPYTKENEQIERYLSDFTNRGGVLLSIAGIFSAFQFFTDSVSLEYFLKFSFPFLVLAIFSYLFSSKRYNFIPSLNNSLHPFKINEILKKVFERSVYFHRLTDASLTAFFISFVSFYYLETFFMVPDGMMGVLITIIVILLSVLRYQMISQNSYSEDKGVYPTGVAPDDWLEK